MNKTELIAAIAEKAELSKKDAERALAAFIESVEGALAKNDKVQLVGFGTFTAKKREARTGRNPQTGEELYQINSQSHAVKKVKKGLLCP